MTIFDHSCRVAALSAPGQPRLLARARIRKALAEIREWRSWSNPNLADNGHRRRSRAIGWAIELIAREWPAARRAG